ncbi:Putative alpha/Beta hydrolase [Septoria linicola]|uniref:Alpha/Beta hydrolase n=1 Tax=Septoria linicola TaxID=215465 RepID=A0A9Q9AZ08_9PEZI|nr:putative alpha/Beta hydrolase [Septoria linicola]USW54643.1 Putative alpha/Beta hydrolase [Septoria linicola]
MGLEQMYGGQMSSANGSDSAYATPLTEHMPSEVSSKSKSVEQPRIPREILGVKDAENYKVTGRTIIVALDGTGDQFDADNSNIVHLVGCLKKSSPQQVTYYQTGIGTYDGGGLSNGINAGFDMAVGSGLGVHVRDAYKFIMANYHEGDKICLFGFSRGAYTARCLAGMLHKVGLLPDGNRSQVPFAYDYYKDNSEKGWQMSRDFKKTFCINVNVHFIGVFDSVASVGFIPRKLPLSSTPTHRAVHFRHAMALDEHRAKFKVCRYQQKTTETAGYKVSAEGDFVDTDALEVWFAGCHADIGGGAVKNEERHKLAQIPLRWMIRQCFECDTGIIFKSRMLAEEGIDIHTLWPVYNRLPRPTGGPPPDMLDKYHKGALGPIQRRSSLLEPVDKNNEWGMHHLKIYQEDPEEKPSPAIHDAWTPEQVEDYFDAMQRVNDQLVDAKGWWVLELWPVKVRMQPKGQDKWIKKIRCNLGTYRAVQDATPNLHWTVKHRTETMKYEVKTRCDRNSEWRVVV